MALGSVGFFRGTAVLLQSFMFRNSASSDRLNRCPGIEFAESQVRWGLATRVRQATGVQTMRSLSVRGIIILSFLGIAGYAAFVDSPSPEIGADPRLADFDFLVEVLSQIHPALVDGYSNDQTEYIADQRSFLRDDHSQAALLTSVGSVIAMLHDNHSGVDMPVDRDWRSVPLLALESGLYFVGAARPASQSNLPQRGDRILSIAEVDVAELVDLVTRTLAGARSRRDGLFGNAYLLFSDTVLELANPGYSRSAIELLVSRRGETLTCWLDLSSPYSELVEIPLVRLYPA